MARSNAALAAHDSSTAMSTGVGPDTARQSNTSRLPRWNSGLAADISTGWEQQVSQQLLSLMNLPAGWDGAEGAVVRQDVAMFAFSVLTRAMLPRTPVPSIVPMFDGGVQIEWHTKGHDIEFRIIEPLLGELWVENQYTGLCVSSHVREGLGELMTAIRTMTES